MPTARLISFESDLSRAHDLIALGQWLGTTTKGAVDGTDLYRSALVQAVAAWDRYVHGVVLDRSVEIVLAKRQGGSSHKVGLTFEAVAAVLSAANDGEREIAVRSHVASRLALETFQRPDDVAKAFAMIGVRALWSNAFTDAAAAKTAIGVIVNRRNRIVHACDYDPLNPGSVVHLSDTDAVSAAETIGKTVRSIDAIC